MASYLERYITGEREAVWAELVALGAAVRDEPVLADAQSVVRETMTRVRANVETLVERLTSLGYRFSSDALGTPPAPYLPPDGDARERLRDLEAEYGLLPLALEMWYEIVGAVDFTGVYPRLSTYEQVDPRDVVMSFQGQRVRVSLMPEMRVLGLAPEPPADPNAGVPSDPLVVWPVRDELVWEVDDDVDDASGASTGTSSILVLAPDALGKANVSGGDGPAVHLGDPCMDARLLGDDWNGVPFVTYLRIAFAWGGFPGLRASPNPPRDLLDLLTHGLLPF